MRITREEYLELTAQLEKEAAEFAKDKDRYLKEICEASYRLGAYRTLQKFLDD